VQPLSERLFSSKTDLPKHLRVSVGTAQVLGLLEGKLDAEPTTAYLMTYKLGKCNANCSFCPQARTSKSSTEMLSRVSWPSLPTSNVLTAVTQKAKEGKIKRICIQALNYADVFRHIEAIVKEIKKNSLIAVSVSCQPHNIHNIECLKESGVDRLGIALDASTETLFIEVKGSGVGSSYTWDNLFKHLNEAVGIFGKGNVSTHIIFGLGETEKEAVDIIQRCFDLGVLPALFAFTPVRGTSLEAKSPPKIEDYRRVQLARYLIVDGKARSEGIKFDSEGRICSFGVANELLEQIIDGGLPFRTSGCPDCNRPFYNEKPSGLIYNYPKHPSQQEIKRIKKQLWH
jgi:biotin synthase-related radical SAM superfamily protein